MPLDIIPIEEQAATRCKAKGGDIWATHKRIDDVSLYEKFGQVRRVPLEALTSTPDLTPSGEVIRDIVEPVPVPRLFGLAEQSDGGLLNVRPVGKTYALVPHDLLFKAQAEQLARLTCHLITWKYATAFMKRGHGFTAPSIFMTCRT